MSNSVGNIHKRFYLTLINPSSYKVSLSIMIISTTLITIINNYELIELSYRLPLALLLAYLSIQIDYRLLKGTELTNIAKIHHVAAFSMLFWLLTLSLGLLDSLQGYMIMGMMLVIGFRICIFRSVFGAGYRVFLIAPIMPLLLSLVITDQLLDIKGLIFGSLTLIIALFWSIMADRAGRPWVESTFRILRAYLLASTENNPKRMEDIMSSRSEYANIKTTSLLFDTSAIILPEVHPGPFNPVGGSNIPSLIHNYYQKHGINSIVMHSVSDHALNIPSIEEVNRYIDSLNEMRIIEENDRCTEPVVYTLGKARVTGIAFGRNAILILSLSPYGMEDVDVDVKNAIESHAKSLGMNLLLIDSHNALGNKLNEHDNSDMINAAKFVLDKLVRAEQFKFMVASASSKEIEFKIEKDIGDAALAVIAININKKTYGIGWIDANNMIKGLREYIINKINIINMLEICTSDTHATSGRARNREGYYTLGSISNWDYLSNALLSLSKLAASRLKQTNIVIAESYSNIKVMGSKQFDDYLHALDRSLTLTKITLALTIAVYIAMLIL
ncbi:MAG: DUF2070 family protein [Candidatus Nitrosocaldaceae archaeon]